MRIRFIYGRRPPFWVVVRQFVFGDGKPSEYASWRAIFAIRRTAEEYAKSLSYPAKVIRVESLERITLPEAEVEGGG